MAHNHSSSLCCENVRGLTRKCLVKANASAAATSFVCMTYNVRSHLYTDLTFAPPEEESSRRTPLPASKESFERALAYSRCQLVWCTTTLLHFVVRPLRGLTRKCLVKANANAAATSSVCTTYDVYPCDAVSCSRLYTDFTYVHASTQEGYNPSGGA